MTQHPLWPFGSLSECKHLCIEQWFDLEGSVYPEGLPFKLGAIDFEWSCTAEGSSAIAPLIGSAQCRDTGRVFLWLSRRLLNKNSPPTLCHVGSQVQTLRAHNMEADRSKVWEAHQFHEPIAWHCTLSTHVLLAGASSGQQFLMRKAKRDQEEYTPWFMGYTAMKNIIDVHNFWVSNSEAVAEDKYLREIFLKGSMEDIRTNFEQLMNYSIRDAIWVNEIAAEQEVALAEAMPSEIRHEARGIRGNVSLSLAPWFSTWLTNCESAYQTGTNELSALAQDLLKVQAQKFQAEITKALIEYQAENLPASMRNKAGSLKAKYNTLIAQNLELNPEIMAIVKRWSDRYQTRELKQWLPSVTGLPTWFKNLASFTYESPLVQDLADLTYFGQRVCYERGAQGRKFCFVNAETGQLDKVFSPKKGPSTKDNCGSLWGIDFIGLFEDGSVRSDLPLAQEIVTKAAYLSYWTSIRARMHKVQLQKELWECDADHNQLNLS